MSVPLSVLLCVVLGELCEADVNECASDPCPSESLCFNFEGGYACNCSDPALCPSLYANIVPSSWGVSWEEIVAIIGQSYHRSLLQSAEYLYRL